MMPAITAKIITKPSKMEKVAAAFSEKVEVWVVVALSFMSVDEAVGLGIELDVKDTFAELWLPSFVVA
jgi:hypothetical protein